MNKAITMPPWIPLNEKDNRVMYSLGMANVSGMSWSSLSLVMSAIGPSKTTGLTKPAKDKYLWKIKNSALSNWSGDFKHDSQATQFHSNMYVESIIHNINISININVIINIIINVFN